MPSSMLITVSEHVVSTLVREKLGRLVKRPLSLFFSHVETPYLNLPVLEPGLAVNPQETDHDNISLSSVQLK